jgi:hypothetical protein
MFLVHVISNQMLKKSKNISAKLIFPTQVERNWLGAFSGFLVAQIARMERD